MLIFLLSFYQGFYVLHFFCGAPVIPNISGLLLMFMARTSRQSWGFSRVQLGDINQIYLRSCNVILTGSAQSLFIQSHQTDLKDDRLHLQ